MHVNPTAFVIASLALTAPMYGQHVRTRAAPASAVSAAVRAVHHASLTPLDPPSVFMGDPLWANSPAGAPLGDAALHSQVWPGDPPDFESRVADDFLIKPGRHWFVERIDVVMAVSMNVASANGSIALWSDCDGKPDELIGVWAITGAEMLAEGDGNLDDLNVWRLSASPTGETDVNGEACRLLLGPGRYWVSAVGGSPGVYYWVISGGDNPQGSQGQIASPSYGYSAWTDVDEIPSDKIDCDDFAFDVWGESCCLLRDQGAYDLTGSSSIEFPSSALFSSRSVDQVQAAPGADQRVCRVEAWLATNCLHENLTGEVWANECDRPAGMPLSFGAPKVFETGLEYDGLAVYRLVWEEPELTLRGGENHWLSVVAHGTGLAGERALWLFAAAEECGVNIREGMFRNPFFGYDEFTGVSDPGIAGESRDFALRVWTRPIEPTGE